MQREDIKKISVIIPAYNVEKFIEKTLISLIKQDINDFEIILVDDGSTDKTVSIASNILKDSNIQYKLIEQENKGVSAARNKGLEVANGEYVFFIDGDDYIEKECLDKLYCEARKSNSDVVFSGFDIIKENGSLILIRKFSEYISGVISGKDALKLMILTKIWIYMGSAIYKKDIINQYNIKYLEKCTHGEDQEFIFKILLHSKNVSYVNSVLFHYIKRENSSTMISSKDQFNVINAMHSFCEYVMKFKSCNDDNEILKLIYSYKIPVNIHFVFKRLISYGYKKSEIYYMMKYNNKIRNDLIKFSICNYTRNEFKNWVIIKTILFAPRVYINLCSFLLLNKN